MQIQQRDNESEGEFFIEEHGEQLAELAYRHTGASIISIDHTFVDPSMEGKGIAKQLLNATVKYARENGLKIVTVCEYATVVMEKEREKYADVMA